MTHREIVTNGVRLHIVEAGPPDGEPLVFLHGFPEFWYSWRKQIPYFADRGYRVIVPDQRGYGASDQPAGLSAYRLDALAGDVVGLIDAVGAERACVVGHDWGGGVALWTAFRHPARVRRLVVLNCPHWRAMERELRRSWAQRRKSWYMAFFQLPWLPEWLARRNDFRMLADALVRTSRPGTFTEADLAEYRRAWARPGALTGMINWYRAVVQRPPHFPADSRIRVPTLVLWGARDAFLNRELAQGTVEQCDAGELVTLDDATHWLQHEQPERVNGLIDAFLRREPGA
ncbi:MAG: alpha/beta hydrolase [Gemmataceae bacterium]